MADAGEPAAVAPLQRAMTAEGPARAGPSTTPVPISLGARARGDRHGSAPRNLLTMADGDISGAGHGTLACLLAPPAAGLSLAAPPQLQGGKSVADAGSLTLNFVRRYGPFKQQLLQAPYRREKHGCVVSSYDGPPLCPLESNRLVALGGPRGRTGALLLQGSPRS